MHMAGLFYIVNFNKVNAKTWQIQIPINDGFNIISNKTALWGFTNYPQLKKIYYTKIFNFILTIKSASDLQSVLNMFSNKDKTFFKKITYEIHPSIMAGYELDEVLDMLQQNNGSFLYGTTFRIYKWNKELLKRMAHYNNGHLYHIRFDTGYDEDLFQTIKKYNDNGFNNITFTNSERDNNITALITN